jgi:CubicO group peptidase (beta-lactamase class C family)
MDDASPISDGFDTETLARTPAVLNGVIDAGDLSGAVTLVWRAGQVAQLNILGKRDIERGAPMERDTLFRIASMTKPVTSAAALILMEEGRLALHDPITKWAPEFSNMQVLKSPDGPLDEIYPAPRDITIEDLMTHRAGLAYGFTSVGPIADAHRRALGDVFDNPMSPDQWMKALGGLPLSFPPGERFHYSHATDVLGFIVGRIGGSGFRDFVVDRVVGPLGMDDTDFWIPPEKRDRAAVVYRMSEGSGRLEPAPFRNFDAPPAFCGGGGGLVSTVDDYLRFARLLLGGGEVDGVRFLKPETVRLMTTNRLTSAQRDLPFMGMPFWAGQGFGLGLSVVTNPAKQDWMGAGSKGAFGWPGAFGTWWQADPAEDMVMLFMIQSAISLGPQAAAQLATGQRMGARLALPMFQKLVYAALKREATSGQL